MHCFQCGAYLAEGTRFCFACGAPAAANHIEPAPASRSALTAAGPQLAPQTAGASAPYASSPASSAYAPLQGASAIRHPKESAYYALAIIASVFAWSALALFVIAIGLMFAIPLAIMGWLSSQMLRARLYGNAVRVGPAQYPEIHRIVVDFSRRLGLDRPPDVFIVNGEGEVNALAVRMLRHRYILLMSDLVDLMLASGSYQDLAAVIGHELGHHALGHSSPWKNLFLWPSRFVPFLGPAYSRACELSADRASLWLTGSLDAVRHGLASLACGSHALAASLNLQEFRNQEAAMSGFFLFLNDLFSTHPRLTRRLIELEDSARVLLGT